MVTHNMQQAVRVSDNTAFFLLGEVIEYNETEKLFSIPADKRTEDYITGELVLLDIMLPGEDGISILGKLRKKSATRDLPIIMMTAKGTEYDKVLGLDSGADDYITKPFGMMELVSRVKAVLRRSSRNEKKRDHCWTIKDLSK